MAAMAIQASGCRWALQEPAPHVPSQAGAALHPCTSLPACLPASLPACLPASLPACLPPPSDAGQGPGPRAGGRGPAKGPWQRAVAPAPAFSNPGTLAGCSRLGRTPASASILNRTARHLAAPHHTALGCSLGSGWSELGASGLSSLPGPPRWVLSASSPALGRAPPATGPVLPILPTWCTPTPEPPRPQTTSPARVPCPSWAS